MKKIVIASVAAVIGALVVTAMMPRLLAQQARVCLHGTDEAPAEAARRTSAVRFVRWINTAQAQAFGSTRTYGAIAALPGLPQVPPGFTMLAAADGRGYAFAVKDASDPCGFTLFSDQGGVIYIGAPMQ